LTLLTPGIYLPRQAAQVEHFEHRGGKGVKELKRNILSATNTVKPKNRPEAPSERDVILGKMGINQAWRNFFTCRSYGA